jgi:hypothetical protein
MASFKRIPKGEVTLDTLSEGVNSLHDCLHKLTGEVGQDRELAAAREDLRLARHELLMAGQDEIAKRVARIETALNVQAIQTADGKEKVRKSIAGMSPWKVFTGIGSVIMGYSLLARVLEPGFVEIGKGVWAAIVATHKAWIASGAPTGG